MNTPIDTVINGTHIILGGESKENIYVATHGLGKEINGSGAIGCIMNNFTGEGISVLAFDSFGHGRSVGNYVDYSTTKLVKQYSDIVAFLREKEYKNIFLGGNCFSSLATTIVGIKEQVNMIFMLAPVIDLEGFCRRNVREKTLDENYEIPIFVNRHNNKLVVLNSEFIRDFLENYKNVNLNGFNIPITYAFSGDKDELALPAETRNYLSNFKNSHFVEIKDCEHRISGEKFKNVLSEIINIIKC